MDKTGKSHPKAAVLVAPLDWGMGHASRCVPIVHLLLEQGHQVFIGGHHPILRETFPLLPVLPITPYEMTYAATPAGLMLKFPAMAARVLRKSQLEHYELDALIDKHGIRVVISDQRFGCYSRKVRSIYLSHQLCVKMPAPFAPLEALTARLLRYAAERFDEVWIPDFPGEDNLTGDLTRKYRLPKHCKHIGILSRLSPGKTETTDLLIMLSGPEPQRTLFEQKVLAQIRNYNGNAVVLLGRPGTAVEQDFPSNIRVFPHLPSDRIAAFVRGASAVICRGGYTTIMELAALKKKALLIPTPGQTEQEYLCQRLGRMGLFQAMKQNEFNLEAGLTSLAKPGSSFPDGDNGLLQQAVATLLK